MSASKQSAGTDSPDDNDLVLAEYKTLRDEIHVRIQQQQLLTALTVTALGAIGGVAIKAKSYELLLLVPLVTTTFALMLLEHARAIGELGDYINKRIGAKGSPYEALGRWERSDERGRIKVARKIPLLVLPQVFLFMLCPIAAGIGALASSDVTGGEDCVAVMGLALVVVLALAVAIAALRDIAVRRRVDGNESRTTRTQTSAEGQRRNG